MASVEPRQPRQPRRLRDTAYGTVDQAAWDEETTILHGCARGRADKKPRHASSNPALVKAQPSQSITLPPLDVGRINGTDRRTADRLRRGKLGLDMRLDLHGLTLEAAHRRLLGFLTAAQSSGARCVLVITGKGLRGQAGEPAGRLKAAVPRWLNEPAFRPLVVSIALAQPKDGGSGALYVLVRKHKGHRS